MISIFPTLQPIYAYWQLVTDCRPNSFADYFLLQRYRGFASCKRADIGTNLLVNCSLSLRCYTYMRAIIGGLGMIPGMPHFSFFILASTLARCSVCHEETCGSCTLRSSPRLSNLLRCPKWKKRPGKIFSLWIRWDWKLDTGLFLGRQTQGGELLRRIKGIRKKFAQELVSVAAGTYS